MTSSTKKGFSQGLPPQAHLLEPIAGSYMSPSPALVPKWFQPGPPSASLADNANLCGSRALFPLPFPDIRQKTCACLLISSCFSSLGRANAFRCRLRHTYLACFRDVKAGDIVLSTPSVHGHSTSAGMCTFLSLKKTCKTLGRGEILCDDWQPRIFEVRIAFSLVSS